MEPNSPYSFGIGNDIEVEMPSLTIGSHQARRLHDRADFLRVLGCMIWPSDEAARRDFLMAFSARLVGELDRRLIGAGRQAGASDWARRRDRATRAVLRRFIESEGGIGAVALTPSTSSIFEEMVKRRAHLHAAAEVLLTLLRMRLHEPAVYGGPSLKKAIYVVAGTDNPFAPSFRLESVRSAWKSYKAAAPLILMLRETYLTEFVFGHTLTRQNLSPAPDERRLRRNPDEYWSFTGRPWENPDRNRSLIQSQESGLVARLYAQDDEATFVKRLLRVSVILENVFRLLKYVEIELPKLRSKGSHQFPLDRGDMWTTPRSWSIEPEAPFWLSRLSDEELESLDGYKNDPSAERKRKTRQPGALERDRALSDSERWQQLFRQRRR